MLNRDQVAQVLTDAANRLRQQDATIQGLQEKLASYERRGHAERVVSMMESRGMLPVDERGQETEHLASLGETDLGLVERVLSMAAPNVDMGKVAQAEDVSVIRGGREDQLYHYILSRETTD